MSLSRRNPKRNPKRRTRKNSNRRSKVNLNRMKKANGPRPKDTRMSLWSKKMQVTQDEQPIITPVKNFINECWNFALTAIGQAPVVCKHENEVTHDMLSASRDLFHMKIDTTDRQIFDQIHINYISKFELTKYEVSYMFDKIYLNNNKLSPLFKAVDSIK